MAPSVLYSELKPDWKDPDKLLPSGTTISSTNLSQNGRLEAVNYLTLLDTVMFLDKKSHHHFFQNRWNLIKEWICHYLDPTTCCLPPNIKKGHETNLHTGCLYYYSLVIHRLKYFTDGQTGSHLRQLSKTWLGEVQFIIFPLS